MRKLLLATMAATATFGAAAPAIAAPDPTKPTGEKCVQRAEQSKKLSAAGKQAVAQACRDR
ncbi:MAG: hypothetical protein H0V81_12075, partial [Solirubrobacterales bacterium]|nr:hypothetical protein [Solirubrobacterales bacterium]